MLWSIAIAPHALAQGDAVQLGGSWVQPVTIYAVRNNQLVYETAGGRESLTDLDEISGIRLTAYPNLQAADEAAAAGNHPQAVRLYESVIQAARQRQPWVALWCRARMIESLNQVGRPVEAAQAYVALLEAQWPAAFLKAPPLESVSNASDADKRQVMALLEPYLDDLGEDVEYEVGLLAEAARVQQQGNQPGNNQPGNVRPNPGGAAGGLLLPQPVLDVRGIETERSVVMLSRGEASQALSEIQGMMDQEIVRSLTMPVRFYLLGLAQMQAAEASGQADGFRNAALSFLRIVIYCDSDPQGQALMPYALLEAAYAHERFGQHEDALSLWEGYRQLGGIDVESDAAYAAREAEVAEALGVAP